MDNKVKIIHTDEFGQRVLIKRIYLSGNSINKERLLLLSYYLNKYNAFKDKLLKLDNASCYFKIYNYASGIIFESRLYQNEEYSSLFSSFNFKRALKLFKRIFTLELKDNPALLEHLKEEILANKNNYFNDSYFTIQNKLFLPYSKIDIDDTILSHVSFFDLNTELKELTRSENLDVIFIGKKIVKDKIFDDPFFSCKKTDNPIDYQLIKELSYNNELINEIMATAYIFPNITSLDDFNTTYSALYAIAATYEKLLKNYSFKCHYSVKIFSSNKAFIFFKFDNDTLSYNTERLTSIYNEMTKEMILNSIDDAILNFNLQQISLNSDLAYAIKRCELFNDINILNDKVFTKKEIEDNSIRMKIDTLKKTNTFIAIKGLFDND